MTNRIVGAAALAAALLLAVPACKHKSGGTIEESHRMASSVRFSDPSTAGQLTSGFYGLEAKAWRWSARQFAVTLRPPARSAQQGAVLIVHGTLPASSLAKLGPMTLTASLNGTALAPETYSTAGEFIYRREVPANLLAADSVRIDFSLDKSIPPGDEDKRELGLVVSSVGLVPK
jgi:hypothetical protein